MTTTNSEAFWITISGAGAGALALTLWYFRSFCITSRCSDVSLCFGLLKIKNNPISEQALDDIIVHDHAPSATPQPQTITRQSVAGK